MNSYVYVHVHHDTGYPVIFYVGKGKGNRAWTRSARSKMWHWTVAKHGFTHEIVQSGLTDSEAIQIEVKLIKSIGRRDLGLGPLINFTDGGDGVAGRKRSAEEISRTSSKLRGQKRTPEQRANYRAGRAKVSKSVHKAVLDRNHQANIGKPLTQEHKDKIARSLLGQQRDPIVGKRISRALKGKVFTIEHRRRISEAKRGVPLRKRAS